MAREAQPDDEQEEESNVGAQPVHQTQRINMSRAQEMLVPSHLLSLGKGEPSDGSSACGPASIGVDKNSVKMQRNEPIHSDRMIETKHLNGVIEQSSDMRKTPAQIERPQKDLQKGKFPVSSLWVGENEMGFLHIQLYDKHVPANFQAPLKLKAIK